MHSLRFIISVLSYNFNDERYYKNNIRASKNDFTIIYNFFYDKDNFYLERVFLWKLEREN